jgi:hypothetical protein
MSEQSSCVCRSDLVSRRLVIEQLSEHLERLPTGVSSAGSFSRWCRATSTIERRLEQPIILIPAQQRRRHVELLIRLFVNKQLHRLRHDLRRDQRPNPVTIDR